jgi:hypothetical protein
MQQLQEEYGDEDDYGGEGEGEELEEDEGPEMQRMNR